MSDTIPEGYKMTELGELPEEWAVKKVENTIILKGGSTPSTNNDKYWNGQIPWAVPTDITKLKSKYVVDTERKITKEGLLNCSASLLPKGSILLTSRATIGFLAINKIEMATNQGFINILPSKEISNLFLYYYLDYIKNKFVLRASGSTFLELSKKTFRKFCIPIPPLSEQHRIAEILSAADETIERTGALIAKYRQIKAGLMADLLESGIDEAGRIRSEETHEFKDSPPGRVPEGWEVVSLRKISETITKGTTPTTYGHNYTKTGISFLRVENITESGHIDLNGIKFISSEANEFLNRSKLEEGDVLFSIAGAIGRCALVSSGILPANINQAISLIRFKNGEQLNLEFILQMLLSINVKSQIELEATSLAQTNLNLEQVKNIKLPMPPLPEQRRIAEILTAADDRIEKEERYRDKLLQIKKGLMQDLLTGKVRTKTGAEA